MKKAIGAFIFGVLLFSTGYTQNTPATSPEASKRSSTKNYKDMVLAICLANAYHHDPGAAQDAGSSASALVEWTYYDMENSPDAIAALVQKYLSRNYHHPLAESEVKGLRFDFLKCLDLYHSRDLEAQAKRYVTKKNFFFWIK